MASKEDAADAEARNALNILVGVDGVPPIADFGVAKAAGRVHTTRDGPIKGKLTYMAPEQIRGMSVACETLPGHRERFRRIRHCRRG